MRLAGSGCVTRTRRPLPAVELGHALPQRDRLARVVAGRGREHQPDFIRLRLVLAAIRQHEAVLRAGAEHRHEHLLLLRVHAADGDAGRHLPDLHELLLRHALRSVAQQRVRDLVAHHHRHRIVVARHRDEAGVHGHLAARQAERIGLLGVQHRDVPLERLRQRRRFTACSFARSARRRPRARPAVAHGLDRLRARIGRIDRVFLAEHLLEACRPSCASWSTLAP
jgi:hypothetical protein